MKENNAFLRLIALVMLAAATTVSNASASELGYEITIPKSRIEMPKLPEPEARRAPDQLDLGASSWAPKGFNVSSRLRDTSAFSRSNSPSLYINYLKPATLLDGLYLKAGLNWLSLTRTGTIGSDSTGVQESQTLQLLSLRAGAEYAPPILQILAAQPYVGLALLPSLGLTGRSTFDDGSSYFGVPFEYTAGAQFELSRFGVGWYQARLDLGLTGTGGTVDRSSVSGIGIKGGIRVAL